MFKWDLNRLWAIMSKAYLERSQKSMVQRFCEKVNNFQPLTTFTKKLHLRYASVSISLWWSVLTKIVNDLLFSQKSYIINVRRGSKYILDSGSGFILYEKYKTLWPFFMDGVQLSKDYRATARIQFTFYYPVPRSSWYSFNQLQRDERLK